MVYNPFNNPELAKQGARVNAIPPRGNNWIDAHKQNLTKEPIHVDPIKGSYNPFNNPNQANVPEDWKKLPEEKTQNKSDQNTTYPNSPDNPAKLFSVDASGNIIVSGGRMQFNNLHSLGMSVSERVVRGLEESTKIDGLWEFGKSHIEEIIKEKIPDKIGNVPTGLGMAIIKRLLQS